MFVLCGDADWKYNLANRPVFDPLSAALFLVGLGVALWRRGRADRAALIWWLGMLLPGFLSVAAPQFMRTLGAAPAAVLFAALGLDVVAVWIRRWASFAAIAALWAWPVLAGGLGVYQYFAV